MAVDIYRALQKRLDQYSMGFPATESGIELKILKRLFSKEDAELFLALSPKLETPAAIAARLNQPLETMAARLEDMANRGLLFRTIKGTERRYGTIAFVLKYGVLLLLPRLLSRRDVDAS